MNSYNTRAGELYRATLAEYAKEIDKPVECIDWNKTAALSAKAAELFKQAMGEA